jgi:3-oxo-5alpha-steroid 4-dehydrogenase
MAIRPRASADVDEWHGEADVVVVGFGAAGASAAFEAASAGADVLVLERAGSPGGAAALADGFIYLGGGTPEQREAGFSDSPENMRTFLRSVCGPAPDVAKIDLYCESSLEHRDWLVARGVEFLGTVLPYANGTSPVDGEGLMFTGGENAYPFDEIATPAPRGHVVQGGRPGGKALMARLCAAAERVGVRALCDTRAEALILDEAGRVAGLTATRYGAQIAVRARRAVVLTSGGFINNPEMVAQHAPAVHATPLRLGTDGDDGRGIRMAQAAGARVKRMDAVECALPFNAPRSLVHGIIVNRLGQRFVNEDTYMGRVGQASLVHQDGHAFLIVDEEHYAPQWLGVHAAWVCETAAELEAELALPAGSLIATLDFYNHHASAGSDPLFHKRPPVLTPLLGPLAAFDLRADKFFYAPFTLGGLDTRVSGEVLGIDGEPIPGLYAAGRATSGVAAYGYCSGLSLGDSTFFGRLAGQAAAG